MRLSLLQKYILRMVYEGRLKRFPRDRFVQYYAEERGTSRVAITRKHAEGDDAVNAITKSIERLIDKELMVGYGVRTPHKWYIHEVKLTAKGKKIAKRLRGEQQVLPLKTPNTKKQTSNNTQ